MNLVFQRFKCPECNQVFETFEGCINHVTQEGYAELRKEITSLRTVLAQAVEALEKVPHLEWIRRDLWPGTDTDTHRHLYRVDGHVRREGPLECRLAGGKCAYEAALAAARAVGGEP